MLLYFPNSAFSEEFVEPFLHPSAAERDIDHRKAAAHVGYLFEAGAELGARNADMLRLVRRTDQFETAADLAEGNDLPADMAAQCGPRLLQTLHNLERLAAMDGSRNLGRVVDKLTRDKMVSMWWKGELTDDAGRSG